MKFIYSFIIAAFILVSNSVLVSASTPDNITDGDVYSVIELEGHQDSHIYDVDCDGECPDPLAIATCPLSASSKHEMFGDGGVSVWHNSSGSQILWGGQMWKCRACGERLVTENSAISSYWGRYLTAGDFTSYGADGTFHSVKTNKSLGQWSYTSSKFIDGYVFY